MKLTTFYFFVKYLIRVAVEIQLFLPTSELLPTKYSLSYLFNILIISTIKLILLLSVTINLIADTLVFSVLCILKLKSYVIKLFC